MYTNALLFGFHTHQFACESSLGLLSYCSSKIASSHGWGFSPLTSLKIQILGKMPQVWFWHNVCEKDLLSGFHTHQSACESHDCRSGCWVIALPPPRSPWPPRREFQSSVRPTLTRNSHTLGTLAWISKSRFPGPGPARVILPKERLSRSDR